jgi:hypothetical protein
VHLRSLWCTTWECDVQIERSGCKHSHSSVSNAQRTLRVMAVPTESFPAGSPNVRSRHARISFPPTDPPSDPDSFGDHSSIGLGPPPPMRRTSTGLEISTSGDHRTEGRRRAKSAHVPSALSGRPQAQRHAQTVRRILTTSEATRPLKYERGRWNAANVESSSLDELEPGVFSDEYDLCASVKARSFRILTFAFPLFTAHEGEICSP